MQQILQFLKNGATEITSIPSPSCGPGRLLIKTKRTLVSAGTEKMLIDFGKANILNKAIQQPDKVRMVKDKIINDGLKPTIDSVLNKLDQPLPLGYCNVGTVIEIGEGVTGFNVGDRVVTNGKHAEVVAVPKNLCTKIPNEVAENDAVFTVLGSIALQGIRLANPTLGETIAVTGLGVIGLLTVQLLIANGCRVIAFDIDSEKVKLAKSLGAEALCITTNDSPVKAATEFSRGQGIDAVIITASTKSSKPVRDAALMSRKRGRIVLVGVTGLELSRTDFYEKELSFQVSCSYGPGRYDVNYEEKGLDYPIGFVRWTEQRNFQAFLDMLAGERINVSALISHEFNFKDAKQAYDLLESKEPWLGIILKYSRDEKEVESKTIQLNEGYQKNETDKIKLSFIGSGNYASSILIPAFKSTGVYLNAIGCRDGVSGVYTGKKFGFNSASTDNHLILNDPNSTAVVIATRHDSHALYVNKALSNKKHVFVEKPLCLNEDELDEIKKQYLSMESKPILTVGYNRRFAPHTKKIKILLKEIKGPKSFTMTVNAGHIPTDHWTQDIDIGGGRLIGEACHFIDLLRYLVDSKIKSYGHVTLNSNSNDTFSIIMSFSDGSIGTINYFANGPKSVPKERLEIFAQGAFIQLDNFRKLRAKGIPGFKKLNLINQDKGQKACAQAFIDAVEGKSNVPIPLSEIFEVTEVCIKLAKSNK